MASRMVPTEPRSPMKTALMLGAAAVAGGVIGKKMSDAQYEKAMKEEVPQSRGVGGPGMVEGSYIADWNRYLAEFRVQYGNQMISIAMETAKAIQSEIQKADKGFDDSEFPSVSRIPIIAPYDRRSIESVLYRNGTNIYLTGRYLVPWGMIHEQNFIGAGDLASPYKMSTAIRNSTIISGHERAFDPVNRQNTLRYIRMMERIAGKHIETMFDRFEKIHLPRPSIGSWSEIDFMGDSLYRPFVMVFDMDIRALN